MRGREQYRLFTKEGNAAARLHYDKAIELDPAYAQAHAGLALTYLHDWFSGSSGALDRAFELAQLAKRLDSGLPLVYEALASVLLFRRQHDEAVDAARRSTEIEPSDAEAHASLAGILNFAGQPQRVAELIEKAKRLNPFHPFYYTLYIGHACFLMRRFNDAVQFIERSIAHNPESLPSHFFRRVPRPARCSDTLAHEALAEVWRISPGFSMASVRAIAAYRREADLDLLTEGLGEQGCRTKRRGRDASAGASDKCQLGDKVLTHSTAANWYSRPLPVDHPAKKVVLRVRLRCCNNSFFKAPRA